LGRSLQYKRIALDVQEENLAAQLLYRKAGFRVVRICRLHYHSQDGYAMVKELQSESSAACLKG
jgi:ribosomal protein S18 acetylase RimI-like enzyme